MYWLTKDETRWFLRQKNVIMKMVPRINKFKLVQIFLNQSPTEVYNEINHTVKKYFVKNIMMKITYTLFRAYCG